MLPLGCLAGMSKREKKRERTISVIPYMEIVLASTRLDTNLVAILWFLLCTWLTRFSPKNYIDVDVRDKTSVFLLTQIKLKYIFSLEQVSIIRICSV